MDFATILWLHQRVGNAAPLFMALFGILNLVNYIRGQGLDGGIIGAIVVGEVLVAAQAALGITMLLILGGLQQRGIHILYGSLSVIFMPGLWIYTRGATDRRASLIWALGGLFMMGLTLRAIGTAG
jgi:hypothetical protein